MKKGYFFALISSVLMMLCQGCFVQKGDPVNEMDRSMFDAWCSSARTLYPVFDIAFNFNAWLNAEGAQRDSIEDTFFKMIKIRESAPDQWTLLDHGVPIYRIETQGRGLQETTQWTVTRYPADDDWYLEYYYPDSRYQDRSFLCDTTTFVFTSNHADGRAQWKVAVRTQHAYDEAHAPYADILFAFEDGAVHSTILRETRTVLEGHGRFHLVGKWFNGADVKEAFLDYQITEPMIAVGQSYWYQGALQLHAFNLQGQTRDASIQFSTTDFNNGELVLSIDVY